MNKRVSLQDIADMLGLSRTTVSWVLSGKGDEQHISLETQQKVLKGAADLNYKPNLIAKTLRMGKTHTIGLIIPSIEDQFYSEVAKAVELEAYKRGYTLTLGSSESEKSRESNLIQVFKDKLIDGLIIAPTKYSQQEIRNMGEQAFPFVLFDRHFPELDTNYVITDDERSGYILTKHLIDKGCRKIATININKHLEVTQRRIEGYRRALRENGLGENPNLVADVEFATYRSEVYGALDRILKAEPDVDGFCFITHIIAIEAINYFHEQGIDFNRRFRMACVHEVPMMRIVAPRMTIARMPTEEIGWQAVSLLFAALEGDGAKEPPHTRKVVLPTELIIRD